MTLTAREAAAATGEVLDELERAVVGRREALRSLVLGVVAGGHVLIEDLPGVGKTVMAKGLACVLGLEFARVQFTPDLLPSDVTGGQFFDQATGRLSFVPGPVFANLVLADEINRTPPKTQAALLEAMAEGQVTSDGVSHRLPDPFVVIGTSNPIEFDGTYPLPEAQLDRFHLRVEIGRLSQEEERQMVEERLRRRQAQPDLRARVSADDVRAMRQAVEDVEVTPDAVRYVVAIAHATRTHSSLEVGASPRATLTLTQVARAEALLRGRDFVTPDDVKGVAGMVLAHRVKVRPELWLRRVSGTTVVEEVLASVPVPATRPTTAVGTGAVAAR